MSRALITKSAWETSTLVKPSFEGFPPLLFNALIRENPKFLPATRSRMISYWDCYYRSPYSKESDSVLDFLTDFKS